MKDYIVTKKIDTPSFVTWMYREAKIRDITLLNTNF